MRGAGKAAIYLQVAILALAGCSDGADRPARSLLEALDGLGLHEASYASAGLTGEGFRVSAVRAKDDAGRPVTVDEILADRPSASKEGWRAARVGANGIRGEGLSMRSLTLVDVSLGRTADRPRAVGSYRATDVRATLHGLPVTAREVTGSVRDDGTGRVAFASLAAAGDTWDGQALFADGPGPGTVSISIPGLRSTRSTLDLGAVLSGVTPRAAMAYALSPDAPPPPDAVLLQASVDGVAAALPQGVTMPDATGFQDPPMRTLVEAFAGMAASGRIGGGFRMSPRGGVPVKDIAQAARAPGAYRGLGILPLTERMPPDVVRTLVPLMSGRDAEVGRPVAGP